MGGDLSDGQTGEAPSFMVAALKDPIGGNLYRIQIIKGWFDEAGELYESAPGADDIRGVCEAGPRH